MSEIAAVIGVGFIFTQAAILWAGHKIARAIDKARVRMPTGGGPGCIKFEWPKEDH